MEEGQDHPAGSETAHQVGRHFHSAVFCIGLEAEKPRALESRNGWCMKVFATTRSSQPAGNGWGKASSGVGGLGGEEVRCDTGAEGFDAMQNADLLHEPSGRCVVCWSVSAGVQKAQGPGTLCECVSASVLCPCSARSEGRARGEV